MGGSASEESSTHAENKNKLTIFCTTSRIFPSPSLRQRRTHTRSAQAYNKLHGLEVQDWHYRDSLKTEYNTIGSKQQVDVILANPPFGASIADGIETNFPWSFRCRESADLFVILMIQLLKPGGRCAIVLPDGCITGDGYKERIREKLLTDCNLHTIVRLPQSTFHPATVSTNLLFFQKNTPTKEIWYYEHRLPEGQKSYSKTKPIHFDEFAPMIKWWNKRQENEVA